MFCTARGSYEGFYYNDNVVPPNVRPWKACAGGGVQRSIRGAAQPERVRLIPVMDVAGTRLPVAHEDPGPAEVRDSLADIGRAVSAFGYEP